MKDKLTEAVNHATLAVEFLSDAHSASIDAGNEFATIAIMQQIHQSVDLRRALEQLLAAASITK